MAEPPIEGLYRRWTSVAIDGDRLEVLGRTAGPAGTSVLELPDGSVWEVDHADPGRLVGLEVDAEDAAGTQLLNAAFGGDGAIEVVDQAEPIDRWRPPTDSDPDDTPPVVSRRAPGRRSARRLDAGRLVVLADLAEDPALHPLSRISAIVEAIPAAVRTPGGDLLAGQSVPWLQRADRLAAGVDDEDIDALSSNARTRLLAALRESVGIVGDPSLGGRELARLLSVLDEFGPGGMVAASRLRGGQRDDVAAMAAPLLAAAGEARAAAPAAGMAEPLIDDYIEVGISPAVGIRVRVARSFEDRWVRVLRREGLVLVAQAPLIRDGMLDCAELVVPPDTTEDDVTIQVLDRSELAVWDQRPVDIIAAAVRMGRDAARADRLGRGSGAWHRCARLWSRVGDTRRFRQAVDLGNSSGDPRRSIGALVADDVEDSFGSAG